MTSDPPSNDPRRYGRIGRYEVLSHLATGGICVVYKALDVDLGREVALKILPPDLAAKPVVLERFRREARHAAKLRHENIVAIYEFGEAAGTYFLALEFIEGTDLHDYVARKAQLEPEETLLFLTQAARALEHLHKYGIVHRDVKPSNLLLTSKDGQPLIKLTDLGLSRLTREDEFRVTQAGFTVGTVDYMSPEQARDSGLADIRSDLYSLGCTGYHMLAGKPPFPDGGLTERLYKHIRDEPPDLRHFNRSVPPGLANVLRRLLAKKPADRYQTPTELLRDLAQVEKAYQAAMLGKPPIGAGAQSATVFSAGQSSAAIRDRDSNQEGNRGESPSATLPAPSPEQQQAAAGQFERANEVLALGNYEYGIHLLLSCCQLDPANLTYRRTLRKTQRARYKNKRGSRLAFLTTSRPKNKFKAAKAARDSLKVLEIGEEILVRKPWDVSVQMDMAQAADALGLLDLAVWILEQAWQKEAPDLAVSRALAGLYEKRGNYPQAIALWELLRRTDPTDAEASRKTRDLAATETISRGQYDEEVGRRCSTESG